MSTQKHFTLYSHAGGPNGWCVSNVCLSTVSLMLIRVHRKVAYLLNELGVDYETKYINSKELEQKSPEYLKLNPNGRMPTLVDHKNNDYTVWCVAFVA